MKLKLKIWLVIYRRQLPKNICHSTSHIALELITKYQTKRTFKSRMSALRVKEQRYNNRVLMALLGHADRALLMIWWFHSRSMWNLDIKKIIKKDKGILHWIFHEMALLIHWRKLYINIANKHNDFNCCVGFIQSATENKSS